MKNVTITLSEDVANWVRILAAKNNRSVSRLVGEILYKKMIEDQGYESEMNRFLARKPISLKKSGVYPKREELYDR